MTKFTKAPWSVSIQGLDNFKSIAVIVPNGGFEVTNIPDAEANAHLIAAAPDMYKALVALSKGEGLQPGTTIEGILLKARGE